MSHFRLVLVPALVTLAVTLLCVTGELYRWKGIGIETFDISWLVPAIGGYFALSLTKERPETLAPLFKSEIAALALFVLAVVVADRATEMSAPILAAAVVMLRRAWPERHGTLLLYALVTRVPTAALQGLAGREYAVMDAIFGVAFTIVVGSLSGTLALSARDRMAARQAVASPP